MDRQSLNQLDKVLALADSAHDGEATAAVRMARQMLSRDGLSFGDLARAASHKPRINLPFGFFSGQQMHLETELVQLRQKIDDLQTAFLAQGVQEQYWQNRAAELEQKLVAMQAEAQRWRQLARETVEKLWDLGQAVQAEEFAFEPESDKQKIA